MLPILIKEFKDKKISLIAYSLAILGFIVMYMSIYPSMQNSLDQFEKLYESFPKELFKALGVEELSVSTIEKFLSIELFSFIWPIMAILLSVSRAGSTVAGEIEKRTIALYLALPISRTKILVAKYCAAAVSFAVFILASIVSIIPLAAMFGYNVNSSNILKTASFCMLFMLSIYTASLFVSAFSSERSRVYMILGGSLLLMYVANVVAGLKTSLGWLANYSIFHYFNGQEALAKGNIRLSSVLVFLAATVIFSLLALKMFAKRDISV